jgi:DNA repair exonuclease SbcCD ATPase subunit
MIPVKLVLHNFLSHDRSEIDFSKFNTALILGSYNGDFDRSNGSGKSSILHSIRWVLFDKIDHRKKDSVVKRDKKYCEVEFTFKVPTNNRLYRITRKRDQIIGDSEVTLEQWDGSTFKDISCDTNTLTNQKIEVVVGLNDEVFINSVYFKQNDVSLFADATPSKRKDIIKALLRIEQWDAYHKKARDKARVLLGRIEEKKAQVATTDGTQDQIKQAKVRLQAVTAELKAANTKYGSVTQDLAERRAAFAAKFGNRKDSLERLKQLNREYQDAKKQLEDGKASIKKTAQTIAQYQKEEQSIKVAIKALTDTVKEAKGIDLAKISQSLVLGRTKERVLKEQLSNLEKDLVLGSNCPTCKEPMSKQKVQDLKRQHREELDSLKVTYQDIKTKLQLAERKAAQLQKTAEEAQTAELDRSKAEVKLAKCVSALEAAKADLERIEEANKDIRLSDFEDKLQDLKSKTNKEESDRLDRELIDAESNLTKLKTHIDRLNIEYGSLTKNLEDLVKQEAVQAKIQEELDILNADYAVFDKLRDYFGKDGIQSVIIENVIDDLETYTNDILSKICNEPTTMAIKTQRQTDAGGWSETFDIEVTSGGRTDDLTSFSGGEQFRISLALRLALSNILTKRTGGEAKLLLLDEVSSSLDEKGVSLFVDIVKQLGNNMKVLIITHDQNLKQQFNDVLIVNKTSKGSTVVME